MLVSLCGISERWYKACLRSVTASSGHSRPSGTSTLTKWNPALDHPEGFGTEGKRTPQQTVPCADCALLVQLQQLPHHCLALAFVALWPQSFSRKRWVVLHWKQPGVLPACWDALCSHWIGIGVYWCRSVGAEALVQEVLNWRSILFPTELGPGTMTSFLLAYVINTEDPN